jgi:alanine-glyoxylate transaminase/serine-glyoxylate transaminase/serine-pyruvate transaminase
MAGPRAMDAFRARETPVGNYYADWSNWLPVMQAYEARKASYFGTPAVNLVWGLNTSLGQILAEGLEARWQRHQALGRACRAGLGALGLDQVPFGPDCAAHTMTAPRYPAGVDAGLLNRVAAAGVVLAGGLHPEIKAQYFRIGHMGSAGLGDILATVGALEEGLARSGYRFRLGAGVAAAAAAYPAPAANGR